MYGPMLAPTPREERPGAGPRNEAGGGARAARRRPHVCFVAPSTWPVLSGSRDIPIVGGAELQQSVIAPALAERGLRVSMITLDYGQPDLAEVRGVTVHKMCGPHEGVPVLRFVHPRLTSLWSAMARVDADVYYHRSTASTTGFVAHFCQRYGKRSIYACASDVDFQPGKEEIAYARDRWLFQYGLRNVDRILVQNPTQLRLLRENYGREGLLIPNCYRAPAGARASRKGYVLWVGNLRTSKRPELLVEMARRLPQYRFVMVGGQDSSSRGDEAVRAVRAAAERLPNLDYRGFLPLADTERMFDGARLLVNTSRYEGFPNTFLQAWARGVPTVGFVDTQSRDESGRPVYSVAADFDDAVACVDRLMRDDLAWRDASLRVAGHFEERHSVDAVVQQFERELLALHGAR